MGEIITLRHGKDPRYLKRITRQDRTRMNCQIDPTGITDVSSACA
jgi:hypothetical protein